MSKECSSDCSSYGQSCASRRDEPNSLLEAPHPLSSIKKVVGVVSGKGGVGKSMVTSLLAVMLQRAGYQAAILDADITGPSIPKSFGIQSRAEDGGEFGILPKKTATGIQLMSINLLLEREDTPVVWRGPVIANTVKQLYSGVVWANVDFLLLDLPPGTGDVPLTIFQSLPVDGIIMVTSPQDLVSMVVSKAVNMAKLMHIPVLGLVENMSYVECPDCKKKIELFGKSHAQQTADKHGIELLGRIPVEPTLAAMCDNGQIELFDGDWLKAALDKLTAL
ncbi:MAG: P-loop NTPase [Christensenellales bacterium]|jgi:Mrp family chromosome partitioning ATPase